MTKGFISDLANWMAKKDAERDAKKKRKDAAAVAFLALRSDIEEGIDAGYSLWSIWQFMHETGRIQYGYDSFRYNVKKYIKPDSSTGPTLAAKVPATNSASVVSSAVTTVVESASPSASLQQDPIVVQPVEKPGFTFNPTRKR